MASTFNLYDAKTRLSELVDRAAAGEEIVIAKAGKPVARLVPYEVRRGNRILGRDASVITIPEDLDAELPDQLPELFES